MKHLENMQSAWGKNFRLFIATFVLLALALALSFSDTVVARSDLLVFVYEGISTFDFFREAPELMFIPVIGGFLFFVAILLFVLPIVTLLSRRTHTLIWTFQQSIQRQMPCLG